MRFSAFKTLLVGASPLYCLVGVILLLAFLANLPVIYVLPINHDQRAPATDAASTEGEAPKPTPHAEEAPAAPLPWFRRLSIRRAETRVTRAARDVLGLTIFLASMIAMVWCINWQAANLVDPAYRYLTSQLAALLARLANFNVNRNINLNFKLNFKHFIEGALSLLGLAAASPPSAFLGRSLSAILPQSLSPSSLLRQLLSLPQAWTRGRAAAWAHVAVGCDYYASLFPADDALTGHSLTSLLSLLKEEVGQGRARVGGVMDGCGGVWQCAQSIDTGVRQLPTGYQIVLCMVVLGVVAFCPILTITPRDSTQPPQSFLRRLCLCRPPRLVPTLAAALFWLMAFGAFIVAQAWTANVLVHVCSSLLRPRLPPLAPLLSSMWVSFVTQSGAYIRACDAKPLGTLHVVLVLVCGCGVVHAASTRLPLLLTSMYQNIVLEVGAWVYYRMNQGCQRPKGEEGGKRTGVRATGAGVVSSITQTKQEEEGKVCSKKGNVNKVEKEGRGGKEKGEEGEGEETVGEGQQGEAMAQHTHETQVHHKEAQCVEVVVTRVELQQLLAALQHAHAQVAEIQARADAMAAEIAVLRTTIGVRAA